MGGNNVFNEDDALKYIREYIGDKISSKYSDDDILCVIDTIWNYYEDNGFLSLSADIEEEELLDPDTLISYVKKVISKEEDLKIDPSDIEKIVKGDLEYEESLEDFI